MKLETCIDNYIQEERKQDLIRICRKLGGFADNESPYNYLKTKILSKLMDESYIGNILEKYILESGQDVSEEISNLILGLTVNNIDRLNNILTEWGFLYDGKIPDEIADSIFQKYIDKHRVCISGWKKSNSYSMVLETVYIISVIFVYGNIKQELDYESLKRHAFKFKIDEGTLSKILTLLINKWKILIPKQYKLDTRKTIEEWINDHGKVEFIMDIYHIFLGHNEDYNEMLYNMSTFEDSGRYWIKESYLKQRYKYKMINELFKFGIIEKFNSNEGVLYRKSEIGIVLSEKRLPDSWNYFDGIIEIEDKIYMPHNLNPFLIFECFLKNEFEEDSDYMLILKNGKFVQS